MAARTLFLSKLLGLYLVFFGLGFVAQRDSTVQLLTALVHDAPLMYVFGMVALVAGLAIILSHNVWTQGIVPLVVTLFGWILFLKGLLSFLAPQAAAGLYNAAQFQSLSPVYAAVMLVLGGYLTYSGFRSAGKITS
jgi:hypothetical protein